MSYDPRSPERPNPSSRPPGWAPAGQPGRAASGVPRGPRPPEPASSTFLPQHPALRVALFAAGILILALCAALTVSFGAALLPGLRAASQPAATTTGADATSVISQFCGDEQSQRYPQAYALFSTQLQGQMSQAQFVQRSQQLDSSKGTVSQCEPAQGGEVSTSPTSETFDMAVSRTLQGTTTSYSGEISVVKTGSAWSIDTLDSSLGLT